MDKRYQVFVSSTYADLKNERSAVIQTIMEMDCIPAGMELFPATDEEQWEFIKKVINDCDYYIIIIGGRYGSIGPEGLSYTEMEYDYALEAGLKVIAFVHEEPDSLPFEKMESDPEFKTKLIAFRNKVSTGRLVKMWSNPEHLPGMVALSLQRTIRIFPALGWVRANKTNNEEILKEINELRKENQIFRKQIDDYKKNSKSNLENLAALDEIITLNLTRWSKRDNKYTRFQKEITWKRLTFCFLPYILNCPSEQAARRYLEKVFSEEFNTTVDGIVDQDFLTIKIQLKALNYIQIEYSKTTKGDAAWFWILTSLGQEFLIKERTIKTNT